MRCDAHSVAWGDAENGGEGCTRDGLGARRQRGSKPRNDTVRDVAVGQNRERSVCVCVFVFVCCRCPYSVSAWFSVCACVSVCVLRVSVSSCLYLCVSEDNASRLVLSCLVSSPFVLSSFSPVLCFPRFSDLRMTNKRGSKSGQFSFGLDLSSWFAWGLVLKCVTAHGLISWRRLEVAIIHFLFLKFLDLCPSKRQSSVLRSVME